MKHQHVFSIAQHYYHLMSCNSCAHFNKLPARALGLVEVFIERFRKQDQHVAIADLIDVPFSDRYTLLEGVLGGAQEVQVMPGAADLVVVGDERCFGFERSVSVAGGDVDSKHAGKNCKN